MNSTYKKGSLSLIGTVAMGTSVMIGAGIFAITGQVAEYAGIYFPLAFVIAGIISAFSAYTYIKVTHKYPSSGGIAMVLKKAYGPVTVTAAAAMLMAFSMIINESLVARTFGTYTLQIFDIDDNSVMVSILAIGLIIAAFLVNLAGNKVIGSVSEITAILKIGGILIFSVMTFWASGHRFVPVVTEASNQASPGRFLAAVALAILAFKGFTTITNSGDEVKNPEYNIGRAIVISLVICLVVYLLVSFAVGSSLTIEEIIKAKNYALAEASRPAFGNTGLWFTVGVAIIATASGLLASIFAVSRMLAMLTNMKLIPHSHFHMPGSIQTHTLVYTVVLAGLLAAFFDLSRIASLGVIFYLVMDIIIHWGVLRNLKDDVDANSIILMFAILSDAIILGIFLFIKGQSDPLIIIIAASGIGFIFTFEKFYLSRQRE